MKRILPALFSIIAFVSCENMLPDENKGESDSAGGNSCSVSGFAQKGQLAKGSQVTAFATGADLVATGESFPSNIADDRGSFKVSGKTQAPYLELRVDGYYFDEIKGARSTNPLYLDAFVESSGDKANLNLMTTAIKLRVKYLIKEGKSFPEANGQAQEELLSALGITARTGNFSGMDITNGSESDAVLLAFACLMQNGRDAGGVTTLIQEIASDLESDGKVSEEIISKVFAGKHDIDIIRVIGNLDNFYTEKKIKDAIIPRFYGFIDERLAKDFVIYQRSSYTYSPANPVEGASYYPYGGVYQILAQNDFEVSKDSDWISFEKRHVVGPVYEVSFSVEQNSTDAPRTGHIVFKDKSGNVLETLEHNQGEYIAPKIMLHLTIDDGTRSSFDTASRPRKGDKVLVNEDLLEVCDVQGNDALVEVKPAMYYRVSWPAENMGFDPNPGYVVKTFPAEVTSSTCIQYYGAYKPLSGEEIVNDCQIRMTACTSILSFTVSCSPNASYAVITGNNADDCLSGTATYVWNKNDIYLDPSLVEYYSFVNKSDSVMIKDLDLNGSNYVSILPQTLQDGLTVRIYDSAGNILTTKTSSRSIELGRGYMFLLPSI